MLIAVLAGIYYFRQAGGLALETGSAKPSKTASPPEDKDAAERLVKLNGLKQRWLEAQSRAGGGHKNTDEIRALAKESAESLLCSPESLLLLEFLSSRGFRASTHELRKQLAALFESDLAGEARRSLAEHSHRPAKSIQSLLEEWSYLAGRGCTAEELETFRTSLGNARWAVSAALGWNVRLAESDPVGAMTSVLQLLDSDVGSVMDNKVLPPLIDKIPSTWDLAAIEQLMPPATSEKSSDAINEGRTRLLMKWARLQPAATVNYVMEHPERVAPETMTRVTFAVLEVDYSGGLDWFKTLPAGPHLDAAAHAIVEHTYRTKPETATEYVALIQNQELRVKCIEQIRSAEAGKNHPPEMEGR